MKLLLFVSILFISPLLDAKKIQLKPYFVLILYAMPTDETPPIWIAQNHKDIKKYFVRIPFKCLFTDDEYHVLSPRLDIGTKIRHIKKWLMIDYVGHDAAFISDGLIRKKMD